MEIEDIKNSALLIDGDIFLIKVLKILIGLILEEKLEFFLNQNLLKV